LPNVEVELGTFDAADSVFDDPPLLDIADHLDAVIVVLSISHADVVVFVLVLVKVLVIVIVVFPILRSPGQLPPTQSKDLLKRLPRQRPATHPSLILIRRGKPIAIVVDLIAVRKTSTNRTLDVRLPIGFVTIPVGPTIAGVLIFGVVVAIKVLLCVTGPTALTSVEDDPPKECVIKRTIRVFVRLVANLGAAIRYLVVKEIIVPSSVRPQPSRSGKHVNPSAGHGRHCKRHLQRSSRRRRILARLQVAIVQIIHKVAIAIVVVCRSRGDQGRGVDAGLGVGRGVRGDRNGDGDGSI
jgi:hypothetical protein